MGRKKGKKEEEVMGGLVEEDEPEVEPHHLVFKSGNHNVVDGYRFKKTAGFFFFFFFFFFFLFDFY